MGSPGGEGPTPVSFRAMRWTCHVCGQERPDAKIAVHSTLHTVNGVTAQENIRYCVDNIECAAKAAEITFLGE